MVKVNINGVSLYYEIHGQGKPLVLIAGLACDTLLWKPILDGLSQSFQVVIFDNRGVGQSESPDRSYTIEDMAEDAHALIIHLGLQKPHVLGHSMGGAIAQMFALKYGPLIDKLILSNTLIKFNEASTLSQQFILELRLQGIGVDSLAKGVLPWLFSNQFLKNRKEVEGFISAQLNHPHPQSATGFKRQLEALIKFDSRSWFKELGVPTLIIDGGEDILCPHDSEKLAKGIAGAQRISFADAAHIPFAENPAAYKQAVLHFLKNG